jgi:hypothetical protein
MMKREQIIINAEKIWQKLEYDLRDTNINTLKRDCRLRQMELSLALDWLAKENKITFVAYDKANTTYIFPLE